MAQFHVLGFSVPWWLMAPLLYCLWVMALLTVKRIAFVMIKKMAAQTKTRFDDVFIESASFPLTILIFASGGILVHRLIPMGDGEITRAVLSGFKAVAIFAIVLFVDKFLNLILKEYSARVEILKTSGGIARGFVRTVILGLGTLVFLDSFGVSITPIIASLGIGSLAVALALQPTLENLFAGIQIVADKPILVGHFVRLESGEEGYVHKIDWRSTWIRMLPNHMVVIPNKTLINSRILNYYYPDAECALVMQVGIHYKSDLDHVERVTIEVAQDVLKSVPGGVATFQPFIRYHTFGDFSINFSVILRVREFVDQYLVKHEFVKRLKARYEKEGIVIPYPIEAVNVEQEEVHSRKNNS